MGTAQRTLWLTQTEPCIWHLVASLSFFIDSFYKNHTQYYFVIYILIDSSTSTVTVFYIVEATVDLFSWKCFVLGTSLAVQWLRLHASTAWGTGSIRGWGIKIPHAVWSGQKKERKCFVFLRDGVPITMPCSILCVVFQKALHINWLGIC